MTVTNMSDERGRSDGRGPAEPPAIALRGVRKNFGSVQAVRGIDLDIASGEIVAFLGPNGAGKTSTIDIILGLSQPNAGSVAVYGMHPRQAISRGLVSAVMQTGGLLKDLTVAETAEYTASLFTDTRPVAEVLQRAGIASIADRQVGKCSGGEQQRLRFAMALLSDPELLILDEPTTGMDVEGRRSFWAAIRQDAATGPHRAVRHALPGGSRRLRRPDHPAPARPDRRRRHRVGGQGDGGGPDGARHAGRPPTRPRCSRFPAWTASRCAATPSWCTPATATRWPATC